MKFELSKKANVRVVSDETRQRIAASRKNIPYQMWITSNGSFKLTVGFMEKYGLDKDNELNYNLVDGTPFVFVVPKGSGVSLTAAKTGSKKSPLFTSTVLTDALVDGGVYTPETTTKGEGEKAKEVFVKKAFVLEDTEYQAEGILNILSVKEYDLSQEAEEAEGEENEEEVEESASEVEESASEEDED